MAFDNHVNLLIGTVKIAPSPSSTGETITLMPGDTARFKPNMPVTLFAPDVFLPSHDNAEIAYVRAVNGDVLTLTRGTEGTHKLQVRFGWRVVGSSTAKTIEDLEAAIESRSDRHFTQTFTSSATVVCAHNMGKLPSVTVVDSAGDEVVGAVEYVSTSELIVRFSAATSGQVILN